MIQQKLSLFQCLTSVPSKAVGLEEVVRLIHYDSGVTGRTESYRQMARVLFLTHHDRGQLAFLSAGGEASEGRICNFPL